MRQAPADSPFPDGNSVPAALGVQGRHGNKGKREKCVMELGVSPVALKSEA